MRFALALITLFGFDSAYLRNQDGLRKFSDKSYYPAYQSFLKALELDPLNPLLGMNLARTFEENEEYEKAETGYASVLKILPEKSPHRFEALFNLAAIEAKQNKIDAALSNYQAALEMVPDSKEVKTNIELLWQQGQGQGQDQNKDKKQGQNKPQNKDGDGKDKDQKKAQSNQEPEQKKQPHPFQSKDLSQEDVKKILDEIKNQEQAIRAQEYEHETKDAPRGKDW